MGLGLVVLLAVLQGLTEFLPVSSSGHLRILGHVFGIESPQTLFDLSLHLGTLVPVLFVYRREIGRIVSFRDRRLLLVLLVATIPTGLIGVLLGDAMEGLASDVRVVALLLAVNGGILLLLGRLERSGRPGRPLSQATLGDALLVGTLQGVAIFRGISRSGTTITAGLAAGLDREAAAALSFLLSIPAILGAFAVKLWDAPIGSVDGGTFLLGGAVAAVAGTVALLWLVGLLKRGRLHHFAWYCFALSAVVLVLTL